jgi:hypothetical protein
MAWMPNRKTPAPLQAGTECCRGAIIGAANGTVLSVLGGAGVPVTLLAAAAASAVGALIGLLIWSASAAVPEEPVLPPRDDR